MSGRVCGLSAYGFGCNKSWVTESSAWDSYCEGKGNIWRMVGLRKNGIQAALSTLTDDEKQKGLCIERVDTLHGASINSLGQAVRAR